MKDSTLNFGIVMMKQVVQRKTFLTLMVIFARQYLPDTCPIMFEAIVGVNLFWPMLSCSPMCDDSNADGIDVTKNSAISKFRSGVNERIDFWEHAEENYNQKKGFNKKVGHGIPLFMFKGVICSNTDS